LKAGTAQEVERILNKEIVGPWRGRRLSQKGRADIHELLDNIVGRGSPVSANRTLAWLRRMCSWAIERGLMEVNPCTGVKAPAAETARDRVILSDIELKNVWQAADGLEQPYGAFIKLLILTGARRNEVAEMRWQEIDLAAKLWTLPKERSKNEREHTVPLSDSAVEILKSLPHYGFGSRLHFEPQSDYGFSFNQTAPRRFDAIQYGAVDASRFEADLRQRMRKAGCCGACRGGCSQSSERDH
jgi:integrase